MRQCHALRVLAMLLLASGWCRVLSRQYIAPAPAPLKGPVLGSIGAAPGITTHKHLCLDICNKHLWVPCAFQLAVSRMSSKPGVRPFVCGIDWVSSSNVLLHAGSAPVPSSSGAAPIPLSGAQEYAGTKQRLGEAPTSTQPLKVGELDKKANVPPPHPTGMPSQLLFPFHPLNIARYGECTRTIALFLLLHCCCCTNEFFKVLSKVLALSARARLYHSTLGDAQNTR